MSSGGKDLSPFGRLPEIVINLGEGRLLVAGKNRLLLRNVQHKLHRLAGNRGRGTSFATEEWRATAAVIITAFVFCGLFLFHFGTIIQQAAGYCG